MPETLEALREGLRAQNEMHTAMCCVSADEKPKDQKTGHSANDLSKFQILLLVLNVTIEPTYALIG